MSIPSNLYAEKVFGEHPIALWSLDERVDYLQLIPAEKRNLVSKDTLFGSSLLYRFFLTDGTNPTNATDFNAFFEQEPIDQGVHSPATIDWLDLESRPSHISATVSFAWEVSGVLIIDEPGEYIFNTRSDDGNQLEIDGNVVTSFYGGRGVPDPGDVSSPISLSSGYHTFRYRMQQGAGLAGAQVRWQKPGELSYEVIPSTSFGYIVTSENVTWTSENSVLAESAVNVELPISEQVYSVSQSDFGQFSVLGENVIEDYVNEELKSLTIGAYALLSPDSENLSLELGFTQNGQEFSTSFALNNKEDFKYFSNTFTLPEQEVLSFVFDDVVVENDDPTVFLSTAHGFAEGDKVRVDAFFGLSNVLSRLETYEVVPVDADSFSIRLAGSSEELRFSVSQYGAFFIKPIRPISVFLRFSGPGSTNVAYVLAPSVGQWSAEFMEKSMGQYPEEISGINIPEKYFGLPFPAYGLDDSPGYYLSRENRLLAKNTSMPMVFGSNDTTTILPERFGGPSLIFPGKGFLNEDGRYKTYTLEMWLRLDPETLIPKRIFGPVGSSDGLYVDGPFLSLKIGSSIQSHYVGEWYRPMLVNILVFRNGASMTINGEKVFDLNFDSAELDLPAKTNLAGKDQDWLGFYSYSDIQIFEVDCVAIYSYRVPTVIAKRRWVYGQAVDLPTNLTDPFLGESFLVDYTFSNYGNNHSYPDIARWSQGISENMSFKNKVLQPPEYKLPSLVFNNKSSDNWFRSLRSGPSGRISLKPDQSWNDTDGYLFFDQPQILQQKTSGFYAAFEPRLGFNSEEVLFRLENQVTGSYLTVNLETDLKDIESISDEVISCASHGLKTNDIVKFLGTLPAEIIANREYFVVAIDKDSFSVKASRDSEIMTISAVSPNDIQVQANFIRYRMLFGSPQEVLVYQTPAITTGSTIVAGIDFSKFANFFGKRVSSFINNRRQLRLYVGGNRNFEKTFSGTIYTVGFCTARNIRRLQYLFSANGTPFLRYQFDGGEYDDGFPEQTEVADSGYIYEEYVNDVLSHVASYSLRVKNFFGERYLDIATSSYWQDYVPLSYFAKNFTDQDGRTRSGVDFIQYNSDVARPNSFDVENNTQFYNNENSLIKTYISFQPISVGPTRTEEDFLNTQRLGRDRVVSPSSNWLNTKYEVVNGTIIYPPPNVSIEEVAIVVHVDISSEGIIKNPVRLRSLSLSSQTVNANIPKPVQAKLGASSFPYSRFGSYFDYKRRNPYTIYKDSTPHLYLTKHSGIELTGSFGSVDRGIALSINRERRSSYELAAINFSMRFDRDDLVNAPIQIAQIEDSSSSSIIRLWLEPSFPSDKRFRLFVTNKNNEDISDSVDIYINGKLVTNTIISSKVWNMISLAFKTTIDLSNISGRINFVGPVLFNNVSHFALNNIQSSNPDNSSYRGVDPSVIYGTLVGTSKIIVGDDVPIVPTNYQYSLINNISERSATIRPV
jgi:hypothetical protein